MTSNTTRKSDTVSRLLRPSDALLVVDVQNYVQSTQPPIEEVFPRIGSLVDLFRANELPTIFTAKTLTWRGDPVEDSGLQPWLVIRDGDLVVYKQDRNAFSVPELDETLQRNGTERLFVCGFYLKECVYETVLGGEAYERVVVEDCCGAYMWSITHEQYVAKLRALSGVKVVSYADLAAGTK